MFFFFFFNDTATTEIYTLSLHDALPISDTIDRDVRRKLQVRLPVQFLKAQQAGIRSEEHTSELQSQSNLVCRLLLEKKKKTQIPPSITLHPPASRQPLHTSHSGAVSTIS